MKIPETDLSRIANALRSKPANAAFPSNLDDVILHQIARDLRLFEISITEDDNLDPPLAGSMYLIFHMIQAQTTTVKSNATFDISEKRFLNLLSRYKYYVEREVVSRAIGIPNKHDADLLMADIQMETLASD